MKSEKEIRAYLEELKNQGYPKTSLNMQYEWGGAVSTLEWVLDEKYLKPVIGRR